MSYLKRLSLFCMGAWIAVVAGSASACSIPVFRYALEHWHPDAYQIAIFHDQDLTDQQSQQLDWLQQQKLRGANLSISVIDLRQEPQVKDSEFWESLSDSPAPRIMVKLPGTAGQGRGLVASVPWQENTLQSLVYSSARDEIAERLVAGEVVWLMLESGDAELDDQAYEILKREVAKQQETIKLPEIDEADRGDLGTDPAELKVQFSTLRMSRDDPEEKWFTEMLLSVESDLRDEDITNQPMVFPLFGRGRALYALIGQGINSDVIATAATFLTGGCQCTVKAQNPGVDLLMPVIWDQLVDVAQPEEVDVPLIGLGLPQPPSESGDAEPEDADRGAGGVTDPPNSSTSESAQTQLEVASRGASAELSSPDDSSVGTLEADSDSFLEADDSATFNLLLLPLAVLVLIFFLASIMGLVLLRRN